MRRVAPRRRTAGLTMVEVLISGFLLASLLLVAAFATDRALDLFRQRRASEELGSRASRLLQRVASELAFARRATLAPLPGVEGSSTLTYQRSLGLQGGDVEWGPACTLRWELEAGEADDGLDDDGDGLVDEGELVWIENEGQPDERRVVWGHGLCELLPGETFDGTDEDADGLVDERGLCFAQSEDLLTIRLGLQAVGPDGNLITRVVQTGVFLRN